MEYQKAVTFSYDDGVLQDKQLVEMFNTYDIKCTFNLNTGIQSRESSFEIDGKSVCRMNQEEIGDLYQGHEIAVHGLTHVAPKKLDEEQLENEFGKDIANITKIYGNKPVGMAYAYGVYDDITIEYLQRQGIRYGRTVEVTHSFEIPENPMLLRGTCHHDDDKLFELAEQFLAAKPAPKEQMLFYVWGHSYEFYVKDNWNRIEELCRMLHGRKDIFYGTNRQCLELFHVI